MIFKHYIFTGLLTYSLTSLKENTFSAYLTHTSNDYLLIMQK